jgi:membrane-bound inhibitor of C-type lysozyme
MTDDIMANFNSYKQGRVGNEGVSLGMDVLSRGPVLKKFKEDPDEAENWLISASTGGGKSYFVKALLTYLMADGFVITVMDYEGDEYYNLANYVRAGNPDDVIIVSIGRGSTVYFDPMEIQFLTGDIEVDSELKEMAISCVLAIFRVMSRGLDGLLSQQEEKVVSTAIRRVYEANGITDNPETWSKSKGLRLKMVYDELKNMAERRIYVDEMTDNIKHKALVAMVENTSVYFEDGESKSSTFKNALSINDLLKAKFIVFSFGMKGATSSQTDPITLALKQLSVANIAIQISNYCKYVRKCFNVKVWEEYQRWGEIHGSAEIISNAMTGGRKRGDVNFIITNDLQSMLDDSNDINKRLRQNIQNFAIGKVKDKDVRHKFCDKFGLLELEGALDRIAKASMSDNTTTQAGKVSGSGNRYKHAFCIALDNGKKAITKVMLPKELSESKIFKTGVDIEVN